MSVTFTKTWHRYFNLNKTDRIGNKFRIDKRTDAAQRVGARKYDVVESNVSGPNMPLKSKKKQKIAIEEQ